MNVLHTLIQDILCLCFSCVWSLFSAAVYCNDNNLSEGPTAILISAGGIPESKSAIHQKSLSVDPQHMGTDRLDTFALHSF
jgi:hypothetical protein